MGFLKIFFCRAFVLLNAHCFFGFLRKMSKWDEPDPRVKWALDILDWGETEPNGVTGYYSPIALPAIFLGGSNVLKNWVNRVPVKTNLPLTLAMTTAGLGIGVWYHKYRQMVADREMALIRHYIMTHPEKFPEPERVKLGDANCLAPWPCNRQ